MAAPSGTVWGSAVQGSKTGRQGKIGIYTNVSSTNTQTTVNIQVWFWTIYSCSDGTNNFYCNIGTDITSATTKIGSVDIDHNVDTGAGWSTSNQTRLYNVTKTYNRGTSAATYKIYAKYNGIDMLPDKTMTVNTSFVVPALTNYTISFNANGGSGAPSSQTKYYGKNLTLSSTKPTKNGYTFAGWGTSTTDTSVDYAAGGTYTANASDTLYAIWKKTITLSYNLNGGSGTIANQSATVYNATTSYKFTLSSTKPTKDGHNFLGWSTSNTATSASYVAGGTLTLSTSDVLYAVWKANTYAVKYDANGGTGEPAQQTKTYGVTLKLSPTIPTRTNYRFLGWATAKSAQKAEYTAGSNYTTNSAVTLYAVWEPAYVKPSVKIESLGLVYNETGSVIGCDIVVSWSCMSGYKPDVITVSWNSADGSDSEEILADQTLAQTGKETVRIERSFDPETTYTFVLTVNDGVGSNSASKMLSGVPFTIDCLAGGKGVAFGKSAEKENYADFGYEVCMNNNLRIAGRDLEGNIVEAFQPVNSNGNTVIGWGNYNKGAGNTNVYGNAVNVTANENVKIEGADVILKVGNASNSDFRPYRRAGDEITLSINTAGYVTSSGTKVNFVIPMAVPIIGTSTVTAQSGTGFILRQGSKYTHGSTSEVSIKADSIEVTRTAYNGLRVVATFSDTTDVVNNDAIGVYWNGTIKIG